MLADGATLDLFDPERLAAAERELRQGARDRVAEQRATVARDYYREFADLIVRRPEVAQRLALIALEMHAAKPSGHLYVNAVWVEYGRRHGEGLDQNLRAPAARWLMQEQSALAGRFRTRNTPGDPERAR